MANTQEFITIQKLAPKIKLAVQKNVATLACTLFSKDGLISSGSYGYLCKNIHDEEERAHRLVLCVINKVEQNADNYYIFVQALLEEKALYKEVLDILPRRPQSGI